MRRQIAAAALAGALLVGWGLPAGAQTNGIVIQNNGVDSSDSAAGADNLSISNNPGAGQASSGGGVNNETARASREPRDRDRGERRAGNNAEGGEAAPVDAAAAPVEGELQAYGEGGEYVDPAAAPVEAPQPADAEPVTLQLPNTGVGVVQTASLAALAAAVAAAATAGGLRLRRGDE